MSKFPAHVGPFHLYFYFYHLPLLQPLSFPDSAGAPVQSRSQKKTTEEPKAPRQCNYTEAEDFQLCTTWLDITQDPIIGINKTGDGFWAQVCEKYLQEIPDPIQTPIGLRSRWGTLQAAINKFSGCVVERETVSVGN
ncbi:hypothetical protein VP01_3858g1 [Puccinia sorghi]|uniref:No apical meristem-associated C-terminal domain-containing protein n=1 Tax=Puccinia sorghi TaxID=27349 RepID=A0A0L6UT12_9BASI|nr:hypothetical protein VP01_3858g1 [Puccinia sorghi]